MLRKKNMRTFGPVTEAQIRIIPHANVKIGVKSCQYFMVLLKYAESTKSEVKSKGPSGHNKALTRARPKEQFLNGGR